MITVLRISFTSIHKDLRKCNSKYLRATVKNFMMIDKIEYPKWLPVYKIIAHIARLHFAVNNYGVKISDTRLKIEF